MINLQRLQTEHLVVCLNKDNDPTRARHTLLLPPPLPLQYAYFSHVVPTSPIGPTTQLFDRIDQAGQ